MWGTANDKSDWDLLFVLNDTELEKSTVHCTNVDACCIYLLLMEEREREMGRREKVL